MGNTGKEILITVLLTVYNRMSVSHTIDSILTQSFRDFELLIIDNHSTDGTYELLLEYSKNDERVIVIQNKRNMGQTYSLLKGMEIAKRKYIARIDADDLMHKDRLKHQLEFMENHLNYGLCGSWVQFITDDDRLAMVIKTCQSDKGVRVTQRIGCAFYHPAVMIRRSVLEENGIKYSSELIMAEDYDMWGKILRCSKGMNIPQVLTYYRRGENNDSKHNADISRRENLAVRGQLCLGKEEYPGKKFMKIIFSIEQKSKKSLLETAIVWILYKKYLFANINRNHMDYGIAKNAAQIRMLDQFIVNNDSLWAKCLEKSYQVIRKLFYGLVRNALC